MPFALCSRTMFVSHCLLFVSLFLSPLTFSYVCPSFSVCVYLSPSLFLALFLDVDDVMCHAP